MALSPLDLIISHPWRRATFTTFALSLSFFEAVLLDAFIRGGGREALILADVEGVRASLSELGACRVGKDYELEPVAVMGGVFHPKISVLTAESECHILVGSGNLTFGGWGGNFEVLEHLHPSFAADAILDAADFFQRLTETSRIRHGAADHCQGIAEDLRASARTSPRNGNIRLFHNLDGSISEHFLQAVEDLGGAQRLIVASPFWDAGTAIDRLCAAIGLNHVYVHAHSGDTVKGMAGSNWPAHASVAVNPIQIKSMDEEKPRPLHAKAFEVICKRGRILMSGSANATTAALGANHNVEACIARIHRGETVGWRFSIADPPEFVGSQEPDSDIDGALPGVLRAALEGDLISGQVLTPIMTGKASAFQITAEGQRPLGEIKLNGPAKFQITAPDLEVQSWKGGRLVLRVEDTAGRAAEGFISVSAFSELSRRLGVLGSRLFAVLAGTETPADVAAIMSWFHEDPRRLGGAAASRIDEGGNAKKAGGNSGETIAITELMAGHAGRPAARGDLDDGSPRWSRFMEHVMAAFREPRGPLGSTSSGRVGDDDDDEADGNGTGIPTIDPAIDRSLKFYDRLFDLLVSPGNAPRYAVTAFDLTQYVCERLQPDAAKATSWLQRLIDAMLSSNLAEERREVVAAAILTQLGARLEPGGERLARAKLLRLHFDLSGLAPSVDLTRGFQSVLTQTTDFGDLWRRIQAVRTFTEQARAYVDALKSGQPSTHYADLLVEAPDERATLKAAFTSKHARNQILILQRWTEACPRCHITLPTGERYRLRSKSVATAKSCCNRILVWPGD